MSRVERVLLPHKGAGAVVGQCVSAEDHRLELGRADQIQALGFNSMRTDPMLADVKADLTAGRAAARAAGVAIPRAGALLHRPPTGSAAARRIGS
ncbi:MAG: hypothetical protein E6G64_17920 [Actinobacteria bacterium]|nr:MAG: hypothetical protein E6G64_17920 [Actinomycetota bacterium]